MNNQVRMAVLALTIGAATFAMADSNSPSAVSRLPSTQGKAGIVSNDIRIKTFSKQEALRLRAKVSSSNKNGISDNTSAPATTLRGECGLPTQNDSDTGCGAPDLGYSFGYNFFNEAVGIWGVATVEVLPTVYVDGYSSCVVTVRTPWGEADVGCFDMSSTISPYQDLGLALADVVDIQGVVQEMVPCPESSGNQAGSGSDGNASCPTPNVNTLQRCIAAAVALLASQIDKCNARYPNNNIVDWAKRESCIQDAKNDFEDFKAECRREFPNG